MRPLKDKKYQQQSVQKLVQFLLQSGYPFPISVKTFQSPSSKDFQTVFKFLFNLIDPYYQFEGKFEEVVPVLLKGLRYPFADQINKSNLYTVGSLHAWPTLLGMLIWLVELVLVLGDDNEELNEQQKAEQTFFEYLEKAYVLWLDGQDDFEVIDQELLKSFDLKQQRVENDIKELSDDKLGLENELKDLETSLLQMAKKELSMFVKEKEKFGGFINTVDEKFEQLKVDYKLLLEEMQQSQETMEMLSKENKVLAKRVEKQELSPADVERMTTERDNLSKNIKLVNAKLDDLNTEVWDREIMIQKTMDSLEKLVEKFNTNLYKLDLINNNDPRFSGLKNEIELYLVKANNMVSQDLNKVVKVRILTASN